MSLSPPPAPPRAPTRTPCYAVADALRFFTRLPVPARFGVPDGFFEGVAMAAAVAGVVVGAVTGGVLALGLAAGLPPLAAATFAVAAGVALTGALHEDGLADLADGFGGGATREAKLAIMRDSRVGTYGAAALTLALIARAALVAALAERMGPAAALALIAAAAVSRPLALLPTQLAAPARADGAGHAARPSGRAVAIGCGLGAATAIGLWGWAGVAAAAFAAVAALAVTALARRQIGGYTGDVCGAAALLAELAALTALVMAAGGHAA